MTELKPLQDSLLSLVGLGLEKYGFNNRPKGQSFIKKCDFGAVIFHLAFIKHDHDFDVTSDIGIRWSQVEELVNRDDKALTKSMKSETCTLGCELGNLSEGRQKRWRIVTAEDVRVACTAIIATFAEVALPYIDRFSDQENALSVLSGDGPDSWLHSPIHGKRAKSAVALAMRTRGVQDAARLARAKIVFLQERKDFGLSSLIAFVNSMGLDLNKVE